MSAGPDAEVGNVAPTRPEYRRGVQIGRLRSVQAVTAAAAAAVLLAGCGSSGSGSSGSSGSHSSGSSGSGSSAASAGATASVVNGVQEITITVGNDFRFSPSTIVVHRGKVRVTLANSGAGTPHDWSLDGFPGDYVPLVSGGQSGTVQFLAPAPGKYEFVCTIHKAQGMTGTLVVLPD